MHEKSQKREKINETNTNENSIATKDKSKGENKPKQRKKSGLEIANPKKKVTKLEEIKEDNPKQRIDSNNKSQNSSADPNNQEEESSKKRKIFGRFLVVIIVSLIIFEYVIYVFQMKLKHIKSTNIISTSICLVVFHILYLMMIWSLIITMGTHPGEIPLYWGFYIGDEEFKRKRYCLICNAFKPERSHHCSICNVCVLNMDHHCPWVNNCIGFYNRKFFMQLLFYLLLVLYFFIITSTHDIYQTIESLYRSRHSSNYSLILNSSLLFLAYGIALIICILNTLFFRFHAKLVLENITTIESLDPEFHLKNKFKLSYKENWEQVFGQNKILWFFPLVTESGLPMGDGLIWKTNSVLESASEMPTKPQNFATPESNINENDRNNFSHRTKLNIIKNYLDNEMKTRNDAASSNLNNAYSTDNPIENYYSTNLVPVKGIHLEMVKFNNKFPDEDPSSPKKLRSNEYDDENDYNIGTPKAD